MNREISICLSLVFIGILFVSVGVILLITNQPNQTQVSYLYTVLHFNATFLGTDGNFTFRLDFLNGTDATILFVGINQANSPNYFHEGDTWFSGSSNSVKAGDNLTFTFLRPITIRNDVDVTLFYRQTRADMHSARWTDFVWHYPYSATIRMEVYAPLDD